MPKSVMPIFEPLPYYMSAIGMQGARFIEGNDGSCAGGEAPAADEDAKPEDGDADEELREPGKRALDAERAARKAAEKELTKLREAETAREREQMTEADRLKAELEEERAKSAKFATDAAVRGLVIDHKLAAGDAEFLATVTDADQREALAKRLAAVPAAADEQRDREVKPGSKSGTGGGDSVTSSIAEYRREISEKRAL